MIRYINIGHQINLDPGQPRQFAFFDTVTDTFLEIDGVQVFDTIPEFQECAEAGCSPEQAERLYDLIPEKRKRF